ncbi:hypothetical protein [Micromonospora sp. C95]|uniref:hypothetical protein n=1 Tax=Micromonospora sp. C95 TaxID=2824882 RepID=UPI001B392074|nr:hypothetical protein [Micromonospora sp. C95]MBQ1023480.1 hypothetical protein [Micromonospora sp. C95]
MRPGLRSADRARPPILDRAGVVAQRHGNLTDFVGQVVQGRVAVPDGSLVDLLDRPSRALQVAPGGSARVRRQRDVTSGHGE